MDKIEIIMRIVQDIMIWIGVMITLHYAAYSVAWGWSKGRSKIPTVCNFNIGGIKLKKNDETKNNLQ